MPDDRGMTRRKAMGLGAAAMGSVAAYDILAGPARALAMTGPGTTAGIGYFARFGVTEKLIQATLGEALSSGGDFADVFFQHQVGNTYVLEDGAVNRAFADVNLGVGVRVVKGDQTGYGFTEDLTPEGLRLAAKTAAAIATGPSRPAPASFRATGGPARALRREDALGGRPAGDEAAAAPLGEREGHGRPTRACARCGSTSWTSRGRCSSPTRTGRSSRTCSP